MRTDIPQVFADAIEDGSRWRGHYLVFHWPVGDQYIADDDGIEYASGLFCDALIAEWGTLTDSIDVEAAISGTGSQTRQFDVAVVNTSETGWWASKFAAHPPENMEVDLYHAVDGAAAVLVGKFVVQSPIEDDEASGVVRLTLLSINQAYDPYVGTLDPVNQRFYPLVVGSMAGVPGTPYGSHPVAKLDGALAEGATTIKTDRPVLTAGFPTSGQLIIDFDTITYTGVNGVYFTGCSGIVKSHLSGQYVFKSNHEYLFAFGAGPVGFAGPVYVDGAVYTKAHTIYKDRNPVQVGFVGEYPFVREASGAEKASTYSAALGGSKWQALNGAYKVLSSEDYGVRVNGSKSSTLSVSASLSAFTLDDSVFFVSVSSVISDAQIWGSSYYGVSADVKLAGKTFNYSFAKGASSPVRINRTYSTSDQSADISTSIKIYLTGNLSAPGTIKFLGDYADSLSISISSTLTYKDAVKSHFDSPSLNIGQSGAKANPSDLIASLLAKMGRSTNIDSTSFASCRAWFGTAGYGLAGFLDGGLRCSEVLKDICWQSRSYLVWDADKVYLRIRYPLSATPVSYASFLSNRREGSIKRRRQDFTLGSSRLGDPERQDSVVNALTVRYQRDIDGDFAARVDVARQESIDKIGRAEGIRDAYLVPDAAYATSLANFWLGEICWPQDIITFSGALIDGLLDVQLGDAVSLSTDWSDIGQFTGRIASIRRTLAQNSSGRADEWELVVAGVVEAQLRQVTGFTRELVYSSQFDAPLEVVVEYARELVYSSVLFLIPIINSYLSRELVYSSSFDGPLEVASEYARELVYSSETRLYSGYGYGPKGTTPWGF